VRDSLQGSLDLLVLKLLSRRSRLHGYAIMSAVRDASDDVLRVQEGSLYPALHGMDEADEAALAAALAAVIRAR
jgi:PadR family transcriptional regulator PadR